jgi:hypothetical protein
MKGIASTFRVKVQAKEVWEQPTRRFFGDFFILSSRTATALDKPQYEMAL